ncbi:MAG: response regulator [Magnetococcales bacterium]|nr:response regulator [Magnetococcales bacterium]
MDADSKLPVVLVVDDEPTNIELLGTLLQPAHTVLFAFDGRMALEIAATQAPDLILLDIMMPGMDGFEACRRMKEDPVTRGIPVIFVTARCDRADVVQGLDLGAFYYLAKPVERSTMLAVVAAALRESRMTRSLRAEIDKTIGSLSLLENGRFRFRTLDDVYGLVVLLSRACPDPERCVIGLTELMLNAVEHGNLGLTYEDKSRLQAEEGWYPEVHRRLDLPEYRGRSATVAFERTRGQIVFRIRDEGAGFDWRGFLSIDPARAFHSHGRGIAMANMLSFDHIEYLGRGNEVRATIHLPTP